MLTSRSRSTDVGPDKSARGAALPRRVPGASTVDADAAAADELLAGARAERLPDAPGPDGAELDVADLPDVSGLLARLVEERIPMALMIDLVNPNGPGADVDEAPLDVE